MAWWFPFRSRSSWRWAVVLCGVAALMIIKIYSFCSLFGHEYTKLKRVMALQPPLLSSQELEQVEYWRFLSPYGLKYSQYSINLNEEFLNESSTARTIFFPKTTREGAVDPRKKANTSSFFYWPGKVWLDTDGNPIQAHGGGIMFDEKSSTYYWYGENKNGLTYRAQGSNTARVDVIGVSCYSSKNLWAWTFEGVVLSSEKTNTSHDLHVLNVVERPKVIYNEGSGKYVMWMHVDNNVYTKAAAGVAVSDSPTGPFEYLYSIRPNGFDSRDMTVFKDEDGRAYLIYSSVSNREIHISPLSDDYLDVSIVVVRALIGMHREAPAVFKHEGVYYMVTSGCSGWLPNEALVHESVSILGHWETIGNPCVGGNKPFRAATFFSQGSFVLPMPGGARGSFIFMADRWNAAELRDSRYLWLPLTVKARCGSDRFTPLPLWSRVTIFWHQRWRAPIKENGEILYVAKPFEFGEDL